MEEKISTLLEKYNYPEPRKRPKNTHANKNCQTQKKPRERRGDLGCLAATGVAAYEYDGVPIDLLHDGRLHVGNGQPRPLLGSPQQGLVRLLPLRPVLVQVLAGFNSSNWVRTRVWSLVSLLKINTGTHFCCCKSFDHGIRF